MGLDRIKWVANEGIRVKAIVDHMNKQPLNDARRQLFTAALAGPAGSRPAVSPPARPKPSEPVSTGEGDTQPQPQPSPTILLSTAGKEPAAPGVSAVAEGGVTFTIPLQVSVRLGTPEATAAALSLAAARPIAQIAQPAAEEAIRIDPDYGTREGYDPEFLGGGASRVPLPGLTPAMAAGAAVNRQPAAGAAAFELPYHHFSVVLNRKRRLAYFTAVNIDGRYPKPPPREKDRWIRDPRVADGDQVGNEFYVRPFDRGHLVRRLDPAWGRSATVARAANDDTFHFTNCSPQHMRFNEGKNLWAGLEDFLLGKAADERKRLVVFTGPVFADDDPPFRGVQIPRRFWKVAVTAAARGGLSVTAYLVSQEELIRPVVEEVAPAAVARLFQVPVRKVEQLTSLDFGRLRDLEAPVAVESLEAAAQGEHELESYDDIVLG
jgi:endonuclease G